MEHKGGIHSKTEALSVSVYNPESYSAYCLPAEPHECDFTMSAIIISVILLWS